MPEFKEIDDRPLAEIHFAQDPHVMPSLVVVAESNVRSILKMSGVNIAQDIVDLGCSGLVDAMRSLPDCNLEGAIKNACFIRENISGSGIGLPCYVPPTRFCLVHDIIGGLQEGQASRHPEGVALCSRELTEDEKKHMLGVSTLRAQEAAKEVVEHFDGESVEEDDDSPEDFSASELRSQSLYRGFVCPKHTRDKPVWKCRFCLAAAIINGPFEPETLVQTSSAFPSGQFNLPSGKLDLNAILSANACSQVDLFVHVACWTRKLVKETP